jgi:pantetheine-phosphate adenylyltransferase
MSATDHIAKRLGELKFSTEVLTRYEEPHRFYHTTQHLVNVLENLKRNGGASDELFLAAVYHDAVYDPRANDNEERSADLFSEHAKNSNFTTDQKNKVRQFILDTKAHTTRDATSQILINADLEILDRPLDELIEYEKQIFREYQFVDYKTYKVKRLEVLAGLNTNGKLDQLIAFVKSYQPLIAVFAGSFNPFHKGHYNVLKKAEKIFDKVIIAFGKNPDKDGRTWPIPKQIHFHQQEEYTGLLTDFVDSLGYDVIVVRGLRNSTDFQYEQNQYRYIQELKPDIKIVNIFCDKEFEHISSSGIRTLEKYGKHKNYLLE